LQASVPRPAPSTVPSMLAGDAVLRFSATTLGLATLRARPLERTERESIMAVEQLASNPAESALLPRLPAVLPKLMSLVRREDSPTREVTDNLGRDPTLIGEVIRIANSPRYRTGREIGDLQAAVLMLGQRGLIQLLIQAAMRPIFECETGRFTQADFSLPWRLSERCSHACSVLAGDAGIDPFQAYLAGIVTHLGWVPALRAFSLSYRGLDAPDSIDFHEAMVRAARRLSGQIARQWSFQPEVCEAVELASGDPLGELVRSAARLSQWHLLEPAPADSELASLPEHERLCFVELQRAFAP
jgi:HD-like signal output (HDOD) protein